MEPGGGPDNIEPVSGSDGRSTGSFTGSLSEHDDGDINDAQDGDGDNIINFTNIRNNNSNGPGGDRGDKLTKTNKNKGGDIKSHLDIDYLVNADSHLLMNLDMVSGADTFGKKYTLDEVSYDRGMYQPRSSGANNNGFGEEKRLYVVDEVRGRGRGGKNKANGESSGGSLTLSSLKKHNDWAAANGITANPIALLQQEEGGYSYKALVESSVTVNDVSKEKAPYKATLNSNNNNQVTILKKDAKQHSKGQQQQPSKPLQQVKIMTRNSESFTKSMYSTVSTSSLVGLGSVDNNIMASSVNKVASSPLFGSNNDPYSNDVVEDIYNTVNFDDADDDPFDRPKAGIYGDSALVTSSSSKSRLNEAARDSISDAYNDLSVFQGISLRVDAPEFTPSFLLSPNIGAAQGASGSGKKGRSRGGRRARRSDGPRGKNAIDFDKLQTPAKHQP